METQDFQGKKRKFLNKKRDKKAEIPRKGGLILVIVSVIRIIMEVVSSEE